MIISAIGFIAIGFMFYLIIANFFSGSSQHPQAGILTWPREKVLASTDNTKQYLEAVVRLMYKEIPEKYVHPYTTPNSIKHDLGNILENNVLGKQLDFIRLGMATRNDQKQFSLVLVADYHPQSMTLTQDERSLKCQVWIGNLIKENRPPLVFVEGFDGIRTWETWCEAVQKIENKPPSLEPNKIAAFREQMLLDGIHRWDESILDDPKIKLYGYDSNELIHLFELFAIIEMEHVPIPATLADSWTDIYDILQHYREQIILARCILEMQKSGVNSAYLVLGHDHVITLPSLCNSWGVKLQVIEPPQ